MTVFVKNIKTILRSKKFNKKIINLGSKSLTLYDLALKIQLRCKIKKRNNKKIKISTNKKIEKLNPNHAFGSLFKKMVYLHK